MEVIESPVLQHNLFFMSLPYSPMSAAASGFSVYHTMDVSIHFHCLTYNSFS